MNAQAVPESQKFTSDAIWVAVSQMLIFFAGLITLPILTKSYSSELFGVWAQINVTVGLLASILILQLSTACVRFLAAEKDKERLRLAFGTMLWPIVIFSFVMCLISFFLRQNLTMLLFTSSKYIPFVPLTFLWASMVALFDFLLSYLRAKGKIKRLSLINTALTVIRMGLIVVLAMAGYSLFWIVTGLVAIEALFVVIVLGIIIREIGLPGISIERVQLKKYFAFSIPHISGGFLFWIVNSSDRYLITHFLSLSQTGIYSVSYTLGSLISFFFIPIGFVLLPTLSKLWDHKELSRVRNYFENSLKFFLSLAIPSVVGLYVLSQPLIYFLTTSEYMVGGVLVLFVAMGVLFYGLYSLNAHLIYLNQKQSWWILIDSIGAFANICINIVLIPKVGIIGAAISTFISFTLLGIITSFWAKKVIEYTISLKFLSKVVLAALLMGLCINFIKVSSILDIVLTMIAGIVIFGFGLFLTRAFSKEDKNLIKEQFSYLNPKLWRR